MDQVHLATNITLKGLNRRWFVFSTAKVGVGTVVFSMYDVVRGIDPLFLPSSILEILKFVPRV